MQGRSSHLLGRGCCGPFGNRVGSPCFLLGCVCCMARSRRQRFVVFCSGNPLLSGLYNHKFGKPIWHSISVVLLLGCFVVRASYVLENCCCRLLRLAVVFGTQPICVRRLHNICKFHLISSWWLVVQSHFVFERLVCLGLLVSEWPGWMVGGVAGSVVTGHIGISSAQMFWYPRWLRRACPQLPVRSGAELVTWQIRMSEHSSSNNSSSIQ